MRYTTTVDLFGEKVSLLPEEVAVGQRIGQLQRRIASAYQRGAIRQGKDLQKLMCRAYELRDVVSRILDRLQNEQAKSDCTVDTCLIRMALAPMVSEIPEIPVFQCNSAQQVKDALSHLGVLESELKVVGYWQIDETARWQVLKPAIATSFNCLPEALRDWFWKIQVKSLNFSLTELYKVGIIVWGKQTYVIAVLPALRELTLMGEVPNFIGDISQGFPFIEWWMECVESHWVMRVLPDVIIAEEAKIKAILKQRSRDIAEMLVSLNRLQRDWQQRHKGLPLRSVNHDLACYRAARLMQHLRRLHPNKSCAWIKKRYVMTHQTAKILVNDEECVTLFPYGKMSP